MSSNKVLTRYIPFTKFISTIEQGLFIPKATLFEDELEGVLDYFGDQFETQHLISKMEIRKCLEWVYISCWHREEKECYAMWKVYGTTNESVAIQTTELDLRLSYFEAKKNMHTYLDDVSYKLPSETNLNNGRSVMNINAPSSNNFDPKAMYAALFSFIKHSGYKFENEKRLVSIDPQATILTSNTEAGYYLPIESSRKLIKQVLIHPNATKWFEELVKTVVKDKLGEQVKIKRSMLSEHGI